MTVVADYDTVLRMLNTCQPHNTVTEIRLLSKYQGVAMTGYFNDPVIAANAIIHSDNEGISGIYSTINPVIPDAYARVADRLVSAKAGIATHDKEILCRRSMLLDFDPVYPVSGISSTNEEHLLALERNKYASEQLTLWHGFPCPALIDSGNGGHGRYLLETLPNEDSSTKLIRSALQILHIMFSDSRVILDQTVFNAARIARIAGTVARKGENTPSRCYRMANIIQPFDPLDILSRSTLEKFVTRYQHLIPSKLPSKARYSGEYPDDEKLYRKLNNAARENPHNWVPQIMADLARPSGLGYRIYSDALGRDLEEAISITAAYGVKDFGIADMNDPTAGRRTPITLVSEILTNGNKVEAARLLSATLDVPLNEFDGKALIPPLPTPQANDPITMPDELMGQLPFLQPLTHLDYKLQDLKPTEWFVGDLLVKNAYNLFSGPPKAGKSTVVRSMVASVLLGSPFLGRPIQQGKVLYIAYEDMHDDLIGDILKHLKLQLIDDNVPAHIIEERCSEALTRFKHYAALRGQRDFLKQIPMDKRGIEFIGQYLEANPTDLVVVDPIRLLRSNERVSNDLVTQEYFQGMDFVNLAGGFNTTLLGLHHDNKQSMRSREKNPLTAVGGTAAVTGAAQHIMNILGDTSNMASQPVLGLTGKGRIKASTNTILYRMRDDGAIRQAPPGSEITWPDTGALTTKEEKYRELIIELLGAHGALSVAELTAHANFNVLTIKGPLNRLLNEGVVNSRTRQRMLHEAGPPRKEYYLAGSDGKPKGLIDIL